MIHGFRPRLLMPVAAAIVLAIGGCANNDAGKTPYAADSAGNGFTAEPVPGSTADTAGAVTPGGAATAPAAMTDANIFAKLDMANQEEVDQGKLGSEKAGSAAVKKFAKMLMTDHGKMKQQGGELATRLNIAPQAPAGDTSAVMAQRVMDMLNAASGPAFDSLFLAVQVDGHQRTLDQLNTMRGMAASDSLKQFISTAIPAVQHHLDQARSLQKSK